MSVTGTPALRTSSTRLWHVGEPGRRCVVALAVAVAQHAEQPAHLGERAAGRGGDGVERGTGLVGPVGEHVGADTGLHGDHRHRVGDDVVQFLGDPQALLGEHAGRALALDVGPLLGLAEPWLSSVSRRARRAIPIAQATVKNATLPSDAERVEPGRVGEARAAIERRVDDAETDDRPPRRAPRGDGVGEEQDRRSAASPRASREPM